ncbi:hypothetical protein BDQ17DRAFT_967173 [Cyathus striatus]|nr:hypothetical protein BDQ17DRAFT_967173 [Cyathus striatus]
MVSSLRWIKSHYLFLSPHPPSPALLSLNIVSPTSTSSETSPPVALLPCSHHQHHHYDDGLAFSHLLPPPPFRLGINV